jgi:hypothetical protein
MAIVFFALILSLMLPVVPAALAGTTGTTNGTYDFGGLNGTSDSAGTGYQALGDKFKVANGIFTTDPSSTYIYKSSDGTAVIHAIGNALCRSFTFEDMGFSAFGAEIHFTALHLVLKDSLGGILSDENLGISQNIPIGTPAQLSYLYPSHGTWNVPGVSTIEITATTDLYNISYLNFENITFPA